jgi:hypothetical protein
MDFNWQAQRYRIEQKDLCTLPFVLDGELFLEQKFPITRDPVNGDQFPIVDDGYLWSSIPKPEVREIQGQVKNTHKQKETGH